MKQNVIQTIKRIELVFQTIVLMMIVYMIVHTLTGCGTVTVTAHTEYPWNYTPEVKQVTESHHASKK